MWLEFAWLDLSPRVDLVGWYHIAVPATKLIILVTVFFFTSVLSVVTGSTSLITVPVMITFGVEAHVAIATNMLALTFMSVGGSLPFVGKGVYTRDRLSLLILLTMIGSVFGAFLVLSIPVKAVRIIVALAMLAVAYVTLSQQNAGLVSSKSSQSSTAMMAGYGVTLALGIYGGFFSGGYVTLLTSTFVILFGMSFLQAVATTKLVNVCSSGVAALVFFWRGAIDLKLGVVLGIAMFFGALLGGRLTLHLSEVWLRRVFVTAVLVLTVKMLWLW